METPQAPGKFWQRSNFVVWTIILGFLLLGLLIRFFTEGINKQVPQLPVQQQEQTRQAETKVDNLVNGTTPPGKNYAAGQILVKFKPGVTDVVIAQHLKQYNASIKSKITGINATVVAVPVGQELTVRDQLAKDPIVQYSEPDYIMHVEFVPNDTNFGNQWALANTGQTIKNRRGTAHADINVEPAWDVTKGAGVKVAVIDTGIDLTHPDLAAKVIAQKPLATASITDKYGHGTHVAGIIAANTNNGQGVAGVCPDCQLLIAKAMDDNGQGVSSNIAISITWATDNGAKVINMSEGGGQQSQTMQNAVNYAFNKGVVLVAAAGNDGLNQPFFPAGLNGVVSVASTGNTDAKSSFSNYGTWVDVAAPGENIYSSLPTTAFNMQNESALNTNYDYLSGTSMSTPVVSGAIALIWSTPYGTSPTAVIQRLFDTADKIAGTGQYWKDGRINVGKAVAPAPSPTAAPSIAPTGSVITPTPSTAVPSIVSPTFVCGGSPIGSVCPSAGLTQIPSEVISAAPSNSVPPVTGSAPTGTIPSTAPSINPCQSDSALSVQSKGKRHHHSRKKHGAISEGLLQLIKMLLDLLLKLISGGNSGNPVILPNPSVTPQPSPCAPSPEMTAMPVITAEVTVSPTPSTPVTTEAVTPVATDIPATTPTGIPTFTPVTNTP